MTDAIWPRILLHIPLERTLDTTTFYHFWQIAARGWPLIKMPPGRLDVQRNQAFATLQQSDATHLAMLDSDMMHAADTIDRLAQHVIDDPTRHVVGGLYFNRHRDGMAANASHMVDGEIVPLTEWDQGLMEVTSLAGGCLLIAREVVDHVPPPWYAYTYPITDDGRVGMPGTDVQFSALMRKHGVKMWLDTTLTSRHLLTGVTIPTG